MTLARFWQNLGATMDAMGTPLAFGEVEVEVQALRRAAVFFDRSARGRIAMYGDDRLSFLQALFTNDVNRPAGEGVYGFFLTAKGRMVADARIYNFGEWVLIETEPQTRETVLAYLEKYHFTEKIEFADISETTLQIGLYGPRTPMLYEILFAGESLPGDLQCKELVFEGKTFAVAGSGVLAEPGFDAFIPSALAEQFVEKLLALQATPAGFTAFEIARTEAGVPRFGVEMNENTIPLEAGLAATGISFTKGCYVGQEVIARIDARGEPAKRLVGFSVDGPLPSPGTPIRRGEREIGTVTSALVSPSLRGRPIAMGYVHKNVSDTAEDLFAGETHLWIVPRPFYPPKH